MNKRLIRHYELHLFGVTVTFTVSRRQILCSFAVRKRQMIKTMIEEHKRTRRPKLMAKMLSILL